MQCQGYLLASMGLGSLFCAPEERIQQHRATYQSRSSYLLGHHDGWGDSSHWQVWQAMVTL
ncbi:hypothetical protein PAXRUDRAFT_826281 [Paxillus rubicundulus Ve08.2h10]|uniref:Uncharacterized protein n=1 Tax=Paxillus rubicundulus Ve08.2h10 TaxID=930991 RepID=A0A0D0E9W6_9AGAM|nr:hypothetical protein PAXRUDRAFT_826281 [Paxillus rubicundulus Ve08.2h10]